MILVLYRSITTRRKYKGTSSINCRERGSHARSVNNKGIWTRDEKTHGDYSDNFSYFTVFSLSIGNGKFHKEIYNNYNNTRQNYNIKLINTYKIFGISTNNVSAPAM